MKKLMDELTEHYPTLVSVRPQMESCIAEIIRVFSAGGTLFTCGNGGSGADADHIAGEFLKGFLLKRPVPPAEKMEFGRQFGVEGEALAGKLQQGLRCISLLSHPGFLTAFSNDVDPNLIFGQQLYALGCSGDLVLGISASGNAENVRQAFMVGRAKGIKSILLTGGGKGKCEAYADLIIPVPATETYRIQELHLPFYHFMCMAVEKHFFSE